MRKLSFIVLAAAVLAGCEGSPPGEGPAEVETIAQDLKVPNTKIGRGVPGGTYFNGTLFLAYTGTDEHIHVVRRVNDQFLGQKLPFKASAGPQLTVYNGSLYLAYATKYNEFDALKSQDGLQWFSAVGNNPLPRIKYEPGLSVYAGTLRAFVVFDTDTAGVAQFDYNAGANSWAHVDSPGGDTIVSPSAAVLGDDLVLSWVDPDRQVRTRKFDPSVGWGLDNVLSRFYLSHLITADTSSPSLLLLGSGTANIGSKQIHFDRTFDGVTLQPLGYVGDVTAHRPHGIRADGSSVEVTYRGTNNALYVRWSALPAN
jgi:hypothetical protein